MLSPRLTLLAVLALGLAVNASVERFCLDACTCRLTLSQHTARLSATCTVDTEFPSNVDANVSLIFLRLGDGDDLKKLKDFRCENCRLDDIDHNAFEGVSDLDPITLASGVLVELQTEALEGQGGVVLQLIRDDIDDCDEFISEFSGLRPTVKVGCTEADADDADKNLASSIEDYDVDSGLRKARLQFDGADTTPAKEDRSVKEESATTTTAPSDASQRNDETAPGGDAVPRVDGIQPLVPVLPDEDPATVFAPWTIAVIAVVGAIIVAVAGYYIWQKWTEIRTCCCGGDYQRP